MKALHNEELIVAGIQANITWENKEDNLLYFDTYISGIKAEHSAVDLIVLPEMFSTGFTMNPSPMAETMNGSTLTWMKELSSEHEIALCGSLIIEEDGRYYNRFVFVNPNHEITHYDKKHLFSFAGEDKKYWAGNNKITIHFKGWSITPFICYDLRFPAWCRNSEKADLQIFVANWPETRIAHWQKLLPARAIENQCYVLGVNRIGADNNGLQYTGHSCGLDPFGNGIGEMENKEGYSLFVLKKEVLNSVRERLPFLDDMDSFEFL